MSISIIRKSEIVAGAPDAWKRQYGDRETVYADKARITGALQALKGTNFTAEQVNKIIGNNTWTSCRCDECGRDSDVLVRIGQEPDDFRWVDVCRHCLTKAIALASDEEAPHLQDPPVEEQSS